LHRSQSRRYTAHTFLPLAPLRSQVLTIARFTLLEAMRTRLPWLVFAAILLAFLASLFAREIAITETTRVQTALLAATLRTAAVFIIGLYVLTSMIREFNDKGLELVLSLDLPRSVYLFGKFIGFALIAILTGAATCIPLAFLTDPWDLSVWGASLALELCIVAGLSLFCVITFNHIMPAATFVFAFYVLSRSMEAIQLIASSSPVGSTGLFHDAIARILDVIALVLPDLNLFTDTEWLVNETASSGSLAAIFLQSVIYIALLLSATLFDLYRRNF
jgi:ABC-type transport system involved in multi-copper enzyme maturation permease subunit